ncbi:hypothetical protein ACFLZP_00475 [Patescibacteria group bacterium]
MLTWATGGKKGFTDEELLEALADVRAMLPAYLAAAQAKHKGEEPVTH